MSQTHHRRILGVPTKEERNGMMIAAASSSRTHSIPRRVCDRRNSHKSACLVRTEMDA
jgi:hypothetical protein